MDMGEVKECCSTCANNLRLRKYDYSQGGCKHSDVDGFACVLVADEGLVTWMVGSDPDGGLCEGYVPKDGTVTKSGGKQYERVLEDRNSISARY